MKSYILAIVLTMFLSALFAFQNIGDVTIRFLIFEWTLPQGVWEVVLFSSGVFEVRSKYKKELKQKDEKIAALEQEKKTILDSFVAKTQAASESRPQESGAPEPETAE